MKGSLLKCFAMNASIEQFVACGLEDIGSQIEFQRLVKEHTAHVDDNNGSTEILTSTSSSWSSGSYRSMSCDSFKPSRKALKICCTWIPRITRLSKLSTVNGKFLF